MIRAFSRHIVPAALLAALIASVVANIYLLNRANGYYMELNAVRLDPLGLEAYSVPDSLPVGRLLVLYGDSRAAQWPSPVVDDLTVLNRGIGAQTTAQALGRFEAHIAPLQPDIILLQIGVNDLKTIPLFPAQADAIIRTTQTHIADMVQRSQALGATVIVSTIFPVGEAPLLRRPYWSPAVAAAVDEVNAYLHTLAGVIVLDAYTLLADTSGLLNPAYAVDELHLSAAGYARLNAALLPLLDDLR